MLTCLVSGARKGAAAATPIFNYCTQLVEQRLLNFSFVFGLRDKADFIQNQFMKKDQI